MRGARRNAEKSDEAQYAKALRGVEHGNRSYMTKVAYYKLSGLGGAQYDPDGAVALLKKRVEDEDDEAKWMLGLCFEYGMGVKQDIERAEELYEESWGVGNTIGRFLAMNGKDSRGTGEMVVEGEGL